MTTIHTCKGNTVICDSCTSKRMPSFSSIRSVEEGIKLIEKIIGASHQGFCSHHLDNLLHIYNEIDMIQKKVVRLDASNSGHVLQYVINKVKSIKPESCTPGEVLFLYYIRNLSFMPQPFEQVTDSLLTQAKEHLTDKKGMATILPECETPETFEKEVRDLVGAEIPDNIVKIIDQKRAKTNKTSQLNKSINEKRNQLHMWRESHPSKWPDYFDVILDKGFIQLFDHLVTMKNLASREEREAYIKTNVTCSDLAFIVLQTMKLIVQAVEEAIPKNASNVIFIVGGTRSGKSTTFCFLCGDQMLLNGNSYQAKSRNFLIGKDSSTSFTFIPSIAIVDNRVIVDFPGFEDTNGSLIALGIECALKRLVKKYKPKLLVTVDIANTGNGYAGTAYLGKLLSRLFQNKMQCILGITKYTKDDDFSQYQQIEEQQRKRAQPTVEELKLDGGITALESLKGANVQEEIKVRKQRLTELQEKRLQESKNELPDTEEKKALRANIKEKELALVRETGVSNIFPLDKLDHQNRLKDFLFNLDCVGFSLYVAQKHELDEHDEKFFDKKFTKDLISELDKNIPKDFQIDQLEQDVVESSLINVVFSRSNPEIGELLHLPEMDQDLVQQYDKAVVTRCINEIKIAVIKTLNFTLIEKIIAEYGKKHPNEVSNMQVHFNRLRKYIEGLEGVSLSTEEETREESQKKWEELQVKYREAQQKGNYNLPTWAIVSLKLPLFIPYGIYSLVRWKEISQCRGKAIVESIENICQETKNVYNILLKLKGLETIILKKDKIEKAFFSANILFDQDMWENSIKTKIAAVRSVYGLQEWDDRVAFMANEKKMSNKEFLTDDRHRCLLAFAFLILKPDVQFFIKKQNGFSRVFIFKPATSSADASDALHILSKYKFEDEQIKNPKFTLNRNYESDIIYFDVENGDNFLNEIEELRRTNNNCTRTLNAAVYCELFARYSNLQKK